MLTGKAFEATAMFISCSVLCASYLLVVWKDRSWINWATPAFFFALGGHYLFPFAYLYLESPGGSHYAYFICYTAYASASLTGSLVYAFVKPVKLKDSSQITQNPGYWPWLLLVLSFMMYLPVLIAFRQFLTDPRRIYEATRTGYGVSFYGSQTLSALAFITFLFKKNRSIFAAVFFYAAVGILAYWHGSKAQLLTYGFIWMLFYVYIQGKRIRFTSALTVFLTGGALVIGIFALYQNITDIADLLDSITGYADYVRNGMKVIDDDHGKVYYGQILLENEFYGRIPRGLMPSKPKDFGPFKLARIYSPDNYRRDEGTGDVDFGAMYADFGPFALVVQCISSACIGFMTSITVSRLRQGPSLGAFVVLLFFAGVSIIPISGIFLLPEYLILAGILEGIVRVRGIRPRLPSTVLSPGNA